MVVVFLEVFIQLRPRVGLQPGLVVVLSLLRVVVWPSLVVASLVVVLLLPFLMLITLGVLVVVDSMVVGFVVLCLVLVLGQWHIPSWWCLVGRGRTSWWCFVCWWILG